MAGHSKWANIKHRKATFGRLMPGRNRREGLRGMPAFCYLADFSEEVMA